MATSLSKDIVAQALRAYESFSEVLPRHRDDNTVIDDDPALAELVKILQLDSDDQ